MVMERARVEDMLALAMKGKSDADARGAGDEGAFCVPPGPVSVSRKMRLEGTFAIRDAFLNDAKMQQQLDSMSERTKGKPKLAKAGDAEVVGSSVSGRFHSSECGAGCERSEVCDAGSAGVDGWAGAAGGEHV